MRRLDTVKGIIDALIVASIISLIPVDYRKSRDNTVKSITCVNSLMLTWGRDSISRKLRYVEIQNGSNSYTLYEKSK
jgi:hypothetical protein